MKRTPKEGDARKLERGNERLEGGELGNDTNKGTKINKFLCELFQRCVGLIQRRERKQISKKKRTGSAFDKYCSVMCIGRRVVIL